jgi:hypothetical protein
MKHRFEHWWQDALALGLAIGLVLGIFHLLIAALERGGGR